MGLYYYVEVQRVEDSVRLLDRGIKDGRQGWIIRERYKGLRKGWIIMQRMQGVEIGMYYYVEVKRVGESGRLLGRGVGRRRLSQVIRWRFKEYEIDLDYQVYGVGMGNRVGLLGGDR